MRKGFTLIEMLVVIAIIGILAGVTIVGYGAVMRDIRLNKTRGECAMLVAACRTYHSLTNVWPEGASQWEIIGILTSPIEPESKEYARGAVLGELKESQLNDSGEVIDPWGMPYVIEFPQGETARVYSFGPDMESDEGHFEGDGCPDGDHSGFSEPVDDVRP